MKLLVTGGAGYVGSVVASQLVDADHDVVVLDNLSKGHQTAMPTGARLVQGDLLDDARLMGLLAEGFDGVLHFAAPSLVGESLTQPHRYYRNNVCGTLNLLDAMRRVGVQRMVFSSTAAVYGNPEKLPIPEFAPTRPTNPYGASKLTVDQMLGFEAAAHQLGAVSLRYFNVAGASGPYGEAHEPETHLIPLVLEVAAGRREAVDVYGTDYPTRDGTAVRDYIHVEDLAHAHLLALDAVTPARHDVYNLGNGAGFSVREVVDVAREVTRRPISTVDSPRRPGDPATLVASSRRIARDLGWTAQKSDLSVMVGDAWAWMQTHGTARPPQPRAQ